MHAQTRREPPKPPENSGPVVRQKQENENRNQRKLEGLTEEARGCRKCDLSENRNQVVFGEGDTSADLFIIGEAPGANEDKKGRPFVGKAGKLLRQGLEKVDFDFTTIYITNTVKCRPPGNRDPKTEELDSCRPYLDQQLEFVAPEVILTLGTFALQYCLEDDLRIGESRGEVYDWNNSQLVATYHPAYILRNNNMAQAFIDDLKQVRDLLLEDR